MIISPCLLNIMKNLLNNRMKKTVTAFFLCLIPLLGFAKDAKYDRGIVMKTFIPKGQWMVGTTFSYSEHVDDNFEFLSVLKDINSEGYTK